MVQPPAANPPTFWVRAPRHSSQIKNKTVRSPAQTASGPTALLEHRNPKREKDPQRALVSYRAASRREMASRTQAVASSTRSSASEMSFWTKRSTSVLSMAMSKKVLRPPTSAFSR